MASLNKNMVKASSRDLAVGVGLGVVTDLMVELFRVPVLNDTGTFGNTGISNFEIFIYGIGILGFVAGVIDTIVGRGVVTFTKDHIYKFLGLIIGVYLYEHTLAELLGIRKFNPYEFAGQLIPPILPADTTLPFTNISLPAPFNV